jgi:hypothetical protein
MEYRKYKGFYFKENNYLFASKKFRAFTLCLGHISKSFANVSMTAQE